MTIQITNPKSTIIGGGIVVMQNIPEEQAARIAEKALLSKGIIAEVVVKKR